MLTAITELVFSIAVCWIALEMRAICVDGLRHSVIGCEWPCGLGKRYGYHGRRVSAAGTPT